MPTPNDPPRTRHFLLKFVSGKYLGGEFPIAPGREIIVGRSSELDIVLEEEKVSRKHAKITYNNDILSIEDLNSTNGTYVNGEKIRRARLKDGDRVLFGGCIARVTVTEPVSGDADEGREAEARAQMQTAAQRSANVKSMIGSIDEVPLVDLLQLFATSKKSGVLLLTQSDGTNGKIFLRKGQIAFASINDSSEIGPLKAVYRLLTWETGFFDLQPPDDREFDEEIQVPTEGVLMEGMRQLDELRRIQSLLPSVTASLSLPHPLTPPLRELTPAELTLIQLAYNSGRIDQVVDRSRLTDFETLDAIYRLIQRGYLHAEA